MNVRDYLLIGTVGALLALIFVISTYRGQYESILIQKHVPKAASLGRLPEGTVSIGSAVVKAEIADEPKEQIRGLSGHPPLKENEGMFFIFPEETALSFWMKEMLFSLDMIWLDSDLRVVDVTLNATPESFPETFEPKEYAKYVLEVNAGFAEAHDIHPGTEAKVTLPDGSVLP